MSDQDDSNTDAAVSQPPAPVYENTNGMPLTNGRNLHMDLKAGEVANRIITVGSTSRAEKIALSLDTEPAPCTYSSDRGFTTISGYFNGIYVSIIAIGMGIPMMDFLLRESRAVIAGPIAMIRYGTCGGLTNATSAGSVVVNTSGSGYVRRNPDAFAHFYHQPASSSDNDSNSSSNTNGSDGSNGIASHSESPAKRAKTADQQPYIFCEVAPADAELSQLLLSEMQAEVGSITSVSEGTNVTADSFYSTQGRIDPCFVDGNEAVVEQLLARYPDAQTLEMETFQMLHLGHCCRVPVRTAAAVIVVAHRPTGAVMDAALLDVLEKRGGKATLAAITALKL